MGENPYAKALDNLAKFFEQYNSDKEFAAWGFGAKVSEDFLEEESKKEVSHSFNLNGDEDDPNVGGAQAIMSDYRKCVSKLEFKEPRHFSGILETYQKFISDKI